MSNKLKKKTKNNNSSYNKTYNSNAGFAGKLYNVLQKEKKNIDMKSRSRDNIIDSITMIFVELVMFLIIMSGTDFLHNFGFQAGSTPALLGMALVFFSIKDIIKSVIRIKNKEAMTANKIIIVINAIFAAVGLGLTIYLVATGKITLI